MEENQKKSIWARAAIAIWNILPDGIKKIKPVMRTLGSIALGGTVALGGASITEASNSDIMAVARDNNKVASDVVKEQATNPLDLKTASININDLQASADSRSSFEKSVSDAMKVARAADSARDVVNSALNLGNSANLETAVKNAEKVFNQAQESEKLASQLLAKSSVEKAQTENNKEVVAETKADKDNKEEIEENQSFEDNVESQPIDNSIESLDPEIINRIKADNAHFNSIKVNPYDLEDDLSNKRVDLNLAASQLKYQMKQMKLSGNYDKIAYEELNSQYEEIIAEYNAAGEQLQQLAKRRRADEQKVKDGLIEEHDAFRAEVLTDSPEYQAREFTPEQLQELIAFRNLDPNLEPGVKIHILSDGLTDIKVAIDGLKKNGYDVGELVQIYNEVLVQRYELAKEALEHPDDPQYDLRAPIPEDAYPKAEVYETTVQSKEERVEKSAQEEENIEQLAPDRVSINDMGNLIGFDAALEAELAKEQEKATISNNPYPKYEAKKETYKRKHIRNPEYTHEKDDERRYSVDEMLNLNDFDVLLEQEIEREAAKATVANTSSEKVKKDKSDSDRVSINDMGKLHDFDAALDAEVAKIEKENFNARIKVDVKNNENKIKFDDLKKEDTINKYIEDEER